MAECSHGKDRATRQKYHRPSSNLAVISCPTVSSRIVTVEPSQSRVMRGHEVSISCAAVTSSIAAWLRPSRAPITRIDRGFLDTAANDRCNGESRSGRGDCPMITTNKSLAALIIQILDEELALLQTNARNSSVKKGVLTHFSKKHTDPPMTSL